MFLWGEKIADARNYSLKLADEYGVLPAAQSSSTKQYPFSSIPVAENDLTLTEATMTTSGWIADGKDVGMKTQLSLNGSLLQEKIMPFRVVDLTRVPKVTEDDRVTGILATMGASSAVKGVDFGGVGDSNILKVLTGRLDDLSGPVDTSVFKMIITPSEDPSVFRAMIWAGYNTLEMEDMDYSEDGVALGANVLTQNLEVGVPGTGDLSQMAQGTYDPKGDYKTNSLADNVTSTDLNLQLEGFYEAEIRYNAEKKEWEVFTVGGGFTSGVGVGFSFSVNAMAGPVPLTATFELGGAIQLDFRTAVRYGQQGEGTELAWSDPTATAVNDFLTTLRINAYVHAFGGIGFDYSIVALKIGLFGNLDVDSQNKFLSRTYLADETKRQINGQALGIQSEVGIKFVATFLFISYEAVIASGTLGATRTFNDWKTIDDYWNSATSGLSLASLRMAAAQSGMQVASASATLQSRDYLEQYARTWGQPQRRMMLFSLNSTNGLQNIQSNANPTSYPQLSDDGKVLAYINDGNSSSIYNSRAHFSTLKGGVYSTSSQIDDPTGFPGYGDTSVSLSGTGSFAAAAWVRMGTDLPGKNAGDPVTLEEQNLLMNSTEIVASVYNGTTWTSTRLTNDGTPDLAPATAVGGNDKAIVFWRSVYTPDPGTQGSNNLLNFTTRDCIMYRCYNSGTWSEAKMLYNGATGSVKALQAAMLPDGTAMAVYSLDRSGTGDTSAYEIAYCTVAADGTPGTAMLATCDSNLDENPQVVAANFGGGDDRFVIGWHSVRDGSSDIQLLAVDGGGAMSNSFPGSLSALTGSGNAVVGGDFRFASLSGDHRSLNDLTIVWNETVNDANGAVDHGILKAAKLRYAANTYTLSAPLELAELPDRTLADHFDAYVSGSNQVQAAIQATRYDDEKPEVIGGVTVPGEETILYTATSDFITDAVAVEQIGVDYATLALNSLTPIRFTIRNTGLNDVTNLTVKLGSGETATLTEKLLPNESTTLTVWHHVRDRVTDPSYTITAAGGINENGTVYLDYPDIGISQMEVIAESAGKRTVRMTLYNSSAATLAGGKNREVKLAFYADDLHTKPAEVACTTNGVSVSGNEITVSGDSALARIDQGTFTLDLTYDLGRYMTSIGKTEIPNVGTYLYAEAWAEGQIGGTGGNQRLPEYDGSDSEASVHMTGALARTGEQLTMDVTQGNDGNGHSTAAITLRNNCLQPQTSAELVATLLDAAGAVLETKKTSIGGAISGETFQAETVTFSRLGTRVVVRAAVPGNDLLTFEGLAVGLGDFTANGTNYTYTLQNDSGATSTLVTAVSGNGEPVSINGQALSTGGSATVAIPNSGTTDIVVEIGTKTYTLTILRNSGTGGGATSYTLTFDTNGGSAIAPITQDYGTAITAPADPTKTGYTFAGWTPAIPATMPAENMTIKAKWTVNQYTLTFDTNGGSTIAPITQDYGTAITAPADPTKTGYTFAGWTPAIPATMPAENLTVTAQWRYNSGGSSGYSYYTIKATAGTGGSISPSGNVSVREGRDQTFTITPDKSYAVSNVKIDGKSIGAVKSYTFENVRRTHTIEVIFMKANGTPQTGVFVDVATGGYYEDAVDWAVENGITKGTDDTHFSPDGICTRAQAVTFLWRAAGSPKPETRTMPFADIPAGSYYYDAVLWAVENDITKGTSDTTFSPNMTCSRAQIVTFLWRSEKSPAAGTVNPFADVKSAAYYADAVLWAAKEDITKGTTNTTFSPDADCTRAQIVTFLWRCKK